jgi:hypothetical protein
MAEQMSSVSWQAYEHMHGEKRADWFWVLGLITIAVTVAAIVLGNTLFGIVMLVSGIVLGIAAMRPPRVVAYEITTRAIRVDEALYPYSTLDSFYINEEDEHHGPQLLVKTKKHFMSLLVIPLPEEYVDDIEELVASRIPEEFLEEPLAMKLFEAVGL